MSGKDAYAEYLKTDTWKTIRAQRLAMDNEECVLCGEKAKNVHHRRYPKKWGTETVKDLVSLCDKCHGKHHNEWKKDICDYDGMVAFYNERFEDALDLSPFCLDSDGTKKMPLEWRLKVESVLMDLESFRKVTERSLSYLDHLVMDHEYEPGTGPRRYPKSDGE